MKVRIDRDLLTEATAWGARFVPQRPASPTLSGIKLEATGTRISVSAFDSETYGRTETDADVGDEGVVLVNGRLLAEIVRALPARPVDLDHDGTKLVLTCGASRFQLSTMPLEEYPSDPEMPTPAGTVAGPALSEAVAAVAIAASRDDMLPQLTGVRVELGKDTITLAATDRYRLAVRELPYRAAEPDEERQALVPAKHLAEVVKTIGAEDVLVGLGESGLFGLTTDARQSTSRLIDAEFPKYRTLFPASAETVTRIDRGALVEAVKRVALVAERNSAIRMQVREGEVVLQARSAEDAQAAEAVAADVDGPDLLAGFNPGYLLDGLGALRGETAVLSFTEPNRPVVITGEEAGYRYLLMPVRLAD